MSKEKNSITEVVVTRSMCKKINIIKPGDQIIVDHKAKKKYGDLVLVLDNEKNYIDKYSRKLEHANTYLICKVLMNS